MLLLVSPGTIHRRAPSFDVSGTRRRAFFATFSHRILRKIRSCFAAAERPAPNHSSGRACSANPSRVLRAIQPIVISVLFWAADTLDIALHSACLKLQATPQSLGIARVV